MRTINTKLTTRFWIALVILWAIGRAVFVKELFGSHGVNGVVYLTVDLISSIPYAIYSARLVITFINHDFKSTYRNIFVTAFFFYIPDLYILIAAHRVPSGLYAILFVTITLFSAFAVGTIARDIKKKRKSTQSPTENPR